MERRHTAGYTLVEMAVVVTIAALMLGWALPSLRGFLTGRQVEAQVGALAASLRLARSEAVQRGQRVSVCRSADGAHCASSATVRDWSSGWLVFVDQGTRGVVDPGDRILGVQPPVPEGGQILAAGTTLYVVSFLPSGVATGAQNNLRFLPALPEDSAAFAAQRRTMCISASGGVRVVRGAAC